MKHIPDVIPVPKSTHVYPYPTLPVHIDIGPHGGVCDLYINGKLLENVKGYTLKVEAGQITTLTVEFGLLEGTINGILPQAGIKLNEDV